MNIATVVIEADFFIAKCDKNISLQSSWLIHENFGMKVRSYLVQGY